MRNKKIAITLTEPVSVMRLNVVSVSVTQPTWKTASPRPPVASRVTLRPPPVSSVFLRPRVGPKIGSIGGLLSAALTAKTLMSVLRVSKIGVSFVVVYPSARRVTLNARNAALRPPRVSVGAKPRSSPA